MPELPEVETVRRGLQPVMEGARFADVVANRGDLRWPLPKDFAARLKGLPESCIAKGVRLQIGGGVPELFRTLLADPDIN